jgi:2-methylcitrate dehydratase PrpD
MNHPGVAVVSAGLAVGEVIAATGQDLITAIAVGYEVMGRVGRALSPSYVIDRGFHPQGVVGPLGAAVTAASLLGLDPGQFEDAISHSVSHAGGTLRYTQTVGDSARLHAGLGAMGGVRSAMLAKAGFRGSGETIEGRYGLAPVYSDTFDVGLMTDGLGSVYSILFDTFKVRPYHVMIHAAIDVVLEALATGTRNTVADIEGIVVGGASQMGRFAGGAEFPRSGFRSLAAMQSSIELAVADAIVHGGGLDRLLDLSEDVGIDDVTLDLARRVVVRKDDECEDEHRGEGHRGSRIKIKAEVTMRDGRALRAENYAKGSYENPVSEFELRDKFEALLTRSTVRGRPGEVAAMILNSENLVSVSDLTRSLRSRESV